MKVLSRKAVFAEGALKAYLAPKLAQDAKIDLAPVFEGLSAKNFKEKKGGIVTAIKAATKDKLAKDANIEDVAQLLDALEGVEVAEGADTDPNTGLPMDMEAMDSDHAKLMAFLKGKLSETDLAEVEKLCKGEGASDEPPQTQGAAKKPDEEHVTKGAMDAALAQVRKDAAKNAQEIRDAERAVRPWVGDLAQAQDSADGVYKAALTALGVKTDGIHPSAYRALLDAQPQPGAKTKKKETLAADAAGAKGFFERYPDAKRIGLQ
jgi:hypothetical protein